MPEKEFPTTEYPKDEKELIIRQWDRVLRAGSSKTEDFFNAVDLLEVTLSDKIDNPNDGIWKEKLDTLNKGIEANMKAVATRRNVPVDELTDDMRYETILAGYKKKLRTLWILTTLTGTFGVKIIKGVLDENVVTTLSKVTTK